MNQLETVEISSEEICRRVLGLASPQVGEVYKDTTGAEFRVLRVYDHYVFVLASRTLWYSEHEQCIGLEKWSELLGSGNIFYVSLGIWG